MDLTDFYRGLQPSSNGTGNTTYIMFHGTTLRNALQIIQNGFVPSSGGMLGCGVYVTRSFQKASAYPKNLPLGEEQVILQLSVLVGKVIKIDYQGHPLQYNWHRAGYDTAWVPPNCGMVNSGLEENCVWDPQRIKVQVVLDKNGCPKNLSNFWNPYSIPMPPNYGFPSPGPMMQPMMPFPGPMMSPFGMTVWGPIHGPFMNPCSPSMPSPFFPWP